MGEENKRVVRRYFELIASDDLEGLDEIIDEGFVDHTAPSDQPADRDGLREFFRVLRSAFPDFSVSVEEMLAENDLVAARFQFVGTHSGQLMDAPASGRRVTMGGVDLFRLRGEHITDLWGFEDMLGLMQQIGALE